MIQEALKTINKKRKKKETGRKVLKEMLLL
jgi:hypothetical protein